MKKLILACCALFVIGSSLSIVGKLCGGVLYGSYYNGALHPFFEPIHHHYPRWHTWWLTDIFDDALEDALFEIDDALEDTLSEIDDALEDALYDLDNDLTDLADQIHDAIHEARIDH